MISLEKLYILIPLQKLPKNVRDLGKLIVAKGLKKLPKVQKIAQSGHTACYQSRNVAKWNPTLKYSIKFCANQKWDFFQKKNFCNNHN